MLKWEIVGDEIFCLVDTVATGFAGLGFGSGMSDSDIVFIEFDGDNQPTVTDRKGVG